MRSAERTVNVLEMKCLRNLVRVSRMDRVRNEEVRRRAGIGWATMGGGWMEPPLSLGGGWATMRGRSEGVESPGVYVTE